MSTFFDDLDDEHDRAEAARAVNDDSPSNDGPERPQSLKRIFVAHAKSVADVDALLVKVAADFLKAWPAQELLLVPGRDDFEKYFKRAGGWDAWARDVAQRTSRPARALHYSGAVVPEGPIGRATAQILREFLSINKPVVAWREGVIQKVVNVRTVNSESYTNGWGLDLTPVWGHPS